MNKIPSNYVPLKGNKILRKGDLYYHIDTPGSIQSMTMDARSPASDWPDHRFFRRSHKRQTVDPVLNKSNGAKATVSQGKRVVTKTPIKGESTDKNVVMIRFQYPDSQYHFLRERDVQLISMDESYIVGLEQSNTRKENGKYHWQFKKYLRNKIPYDGVVLKHYGAPIK